jgi:hypothetical protein
VKVLPEACGASALHAGFSVGCGVGVAVGAGVGARDPVESGGAEAAPPLQPAAAAVNRKTQSR